MVIFQCNHVVRQWFVPMLLLITITSDINCILMYIQCVYIHAYTYIPISSIVTHHCDSMMTHFLNFALTSLPHCLFFYAQSIALTQDVILNYIKALSCDSTNKRDRKTSLRPPIPD